MIEYPEAINLARQMDAELQGRQIAEVVRGNSPHKFAFYNHEPEEYAALLTGGVVGGSRAKCGMIITTVEVPEGDPKANLALMLGSGGERIFLHHTEQTLPKKHQFLMRFTDGDYLTVTIQMWGAIQVCTESEVETHPWMSNPHHPVDSPEFTYDYFQSLLREVPPDDPRSVKFFLISKPGLPGIGNGYTQDILFRARLNPRRRVTTLTPVEQEAFYNAIVITIKDAIALGGRDDELDLFACPGRYKRIMHSKTAGLPCPECGTPIEKIQFLGGASYFCPRCQV